MKYFTILSALVASMFISESNGQQFGNIGWAIISCNDEPNLECCEAFKLVGNCCQHFPNMVHCNPTQPPSQPPSQPPTVDPRDPRIEN